MLESGVLSPVQPYPGSLGLLFTRTSSPAWSVPAAGQQTVASSGDKEKEVSPSVLQNGRSSPGSRGLQRPAGGTARVVTRT